MTDRAIVDYPLGPDGHPLVVLDGCSVSLTRNTETGQLYVYVNTEANDEHDAAGNPYIQIELNDANLYDHEDGTPQPTVIPARWNPDAQAYEV